MNKKQIINKLKVLKEINPENDFSKKSRLAILQTPFVSKKDFQGESILSALETAPAKLRSYSLKNIFSSSGRVISVAVATAIILIGIYFATSQLSPLFLPGLNQSKVVAEANMVNNTIDIQLSHITKFEQTAKASTTALKEVAATTPSHINSSIIQAEQSQIDSAFNADPQSQNNQDINNILKSISQ